MIEAIATLALLNVILTLAIIFTRPGAEHIRNASSWRKCVCPDCTLVRAAYHQRMSEAVQIGLDE